MTRMWALKGVILCGVMGLICLPALAESNLCYNGSFTVPNDPFDGWNINYEWTGNSKLMNNHNKISFLPEFKGKKNVMRITSLTAADKDTKVETSLMEYEAGARYKCTLDHYGELTGGEPVRVFFLGYAWRPGIAPTEVPQLMDMRRVYKSEFGAGTGAAWKTVTATLPGPQISELAYKNLKKVRYMTVMILMASEDCLGRSYIANVKVVKLTDKYKVTKGPSKPASGDDD